MNTITSELLDQCLEYCDIAHLDGTNYGAFIRALVYTMKTELPVEIIQNESNRTIKVQLKFFSIMYTEGKEGSFDILTMKYIVAEEEEMETLSFERIGKADVIQDKKSDARTFYRYYVNPNKNAGYRFTFNRRISKIR